MIILSEGFQRFMNRAGRLVERALSESLDIYTDYTGGADNNMYTLYKSLVPYLLITNC